MKIVSKIYKHHSNIYKIYIFLITVFLIVCFFPKLEQFKYEFQKNKPWLHEDLFAPFDYAIQKNDEQIAKEKTIIKQNAKLCFDVDTLVRDRVLKEVDSLFSNQYQISQKYVELIKDKIKSVYKIGILLENQNYILSNKEHIVSILSNNVVQNEIKYKDLYNIQKAILFIKSKLNLSESQMIFVDKVLENILAHNIFFNRKMTDNFLNEDLKNINYTYGLVVRGTKIISRGELIKGEKYLKLKSLKEEYKNKDVGTYKKYWMTLGYTILVSCIVLVLYLFLYFFKNRVFENNNKVTFLFFNMLLVFFITILVLNHGVEYLYAIPFCMFPLIVKTFIDIEIGLFLQILIIITIGFVVPNSFEFIFLQLMGAAVISVTKLTFLKRIDFFVKIFQMICTFCVSYIGFVLVKEGDWKSIDLSNLLLFLFSGILMIFVHPIIYLYEKIFGLTSDVSLLELSNTNSVLLKKLADKAPGTFQHSLQVANIAETAALEIGANFVLTRVGALYHDIGKMNNPIYFTENQKSIINPHNELEPYDSVRIIINHITDGIEIAKNYKLPESIKDFIRSHHGDSVVQYFYIKAKEKYEAVDINDFRYKKGLKPFSKETAIVMMSDSIEAASKSMKNPSYSSINTLVDDIIDKQIEDNQFINADITLKEITKLRTTFKNKLTNIYHLRVEYPK